MILWVGGGGSIVVHGYVKSSWQSWDFLLEKDCCPIIPQHWVTDLSVLMRSFCWERAVECRCLKENEWLDPRLPSQYIYEHMQTTPISSKKNGGCLDLNNNAMVGQIEIFWSSHQMIPLCALLIFFWPHLPLFLCTMVMKFFILWSEIIQTILTFIKNIFPAFLFDLELEQTGGKTFCGSKLCIGSNPLLPFNPPTPPPWHDIDQHTHCITKWNVSQAGVQNVPTLRWVGGLSLECIGPSGCPTMVSQFPTRPALLPLLL